MTGEIPVDRVVLARAIPFFVFDLSIRRIVHAANAIESLNLALWKALKTKEAAAKPM